MSNDTQENIKSLDPYHNYTLYVSAVNTVGQEGPAVEASEVAKTETGGNVAFFLRFFVHFLFESSFKNVYPSHT